MDWVYLFIAIIGEAVGTSALKASKGFTVPIPSAVVIVGYIITFYFLSLALKTIPYSVGYAVWCGVGIILVTASAFFLYHQKPDMPAIIGIVLITAGVLIVNLFSKSSAN
jgi:multidrug transporter EmrE-like cation transporter